MSFSVSGAVYGDPYTVTWNDDGTLDGDDRIAQLLADHVGKQVVVPPVGPVYDVKLDDPQSILAALLDLTTVSDTTGDVPQVVPEVEAGVVY